MNFANPAWLFALPPLLLGVTLLYFLKLKRVSLPVSSTYLWREAIEDLRVNTPFQRLRMNLLWIMQLLLVCLLLLPLARPRGALGDSGGRDLILLVDRSASMATLDDSGATRLQRAIAQVEVLIADMTNKDRALLIAFAESAEALSPLTNQKRLLSQRLSGLSTLARSTRLDVALRLAIEVDRGESRDRSREIHLFTDGVCEELGAAPRSRAGSAAALPGPSSSGLQTELPKNVNLNFVRVGEPRENVAVTNIALRRTLDRAGLLQLFVGLVNTGIEPVTCGVDVEIDGQLVESREVDIEAGRRHSVVFDSESIGDGRITVSLGATDALSLDDRAYAVATARRGLAVVLVSPGNVYIERVFEAMSFVRLESVTPAQWSERPGRPADVVIFDRVQPVELPRARCLFIDTLPPGCPLSFGKMVEAPRVVDWNELHPVTSYASFSDFDSLSMRTLELRGVDETLVLAEAGPLLALIRDDDRESMVLTIDVMKTNWPFRASFPVFFANAVRWLSGDLKQRSVRAGEVAILKVGRGGGTLRITSPSGELYEEAIAPSRSQHAFNRTLELGFYRVELDRPGLEAQSWDFAVNLEAPLESELSPRDTVRLKSTEAPVNARRAAQRRNRALWRWFAWAALLLLLIEWWIFHRRVFV